MNYLKTPSILTVIAMALVAGPLAAQVDKPVVDIPETIRTERNKADAESGIWKTAKRYLDDKSAAHPEDLDLAAASVHADIHRCLLLGDFRRSETALWTQAEAGAAEVAEAWEKKGEQDGREMPPSPAEDSFRRQYEKAVRELNEMEQKSAPTPQEEEKRRELRDAKQRLGDVLIVLTRVREKATDPQKYRDGAREMRARQYFFHLAAEAARTAAGAHEAECQAGLLMLRSLGEQEQIRDVIRQWTQGWSTKPAKKGNQP